MFLFKCISKYLCWVESKILYSKKQSVIELLRNIFFTFMNENVNIISTPVLVERRFVEHKDAYIVFVIFIDAFENNNYNECLIL